MTPVSAIDGVTSQGLGVGRAEGRAVFVRGAIAGETVEARLDKVGRNGVWATVRTVLDPSPHRIAPACPWFGTCGGCAFWHMDYEEELRAKALRVTDALRRIGGQTLDPVPIHGAPELLGYRNKAQYPVGWQKGRAVAGFYRQRTHRVVPITRCAIQPDQTDRAANAVVDWMNRFGVSVYNEKTGRGLVRHIHIRRATATNQTLVCLVVNGEAVPHSQELVDRLRRAEPSVTCVCLNVNQKPGNVVLGERFVPLYGPLWVEDELCGFTLRISPASFYQVNAAQAQRLYDRAAELAGLTCRDVVLELYCGIGAITLALSRQAGRVFGVEIVADAVADAKKNALRNGVENVEFFQGDAGTVAAQMARQGIRPTVMVVDPPRKGIDRQVIDALAAMAPEKLVYISCDPATLARDVKDLGEKGYAMQSAEAFDLFPRTGHVETVLLMSQQKPDDYVRVGIDLDELEATAAESKATYEEIKAHVLEHTGLKVSNLYISQVKRKCGLEVGKNYNLSKSDNPKAPQCPKEKEDAIMAALKDFQMLPQREETA